MKYKFVGEGEGVPGLPHQITDAEAEALGVADILSAALANGNYVVDTTPPPTPPQMNTSGEESVEEEQNG